MTRAGRWIGLLLAAALAASGCSGSGGGGGGRGGGNTSAGGGATPGGGGSVQGPPSTPVAAGSAGPRAGPVAWEGRAVWATRWSVDTAAKVRAIVDDMVARNQNMLLIQVYGDAMALYPSAVAPRNPLTAGSDFDPLAEAIPYARARGIEVHAWMNVVRVYHGGHGPPRHPQHILNLHPEWTMVDSNGVKATDRYPVLGAEIFACPERQGFHDYCVAVAREIAANYDVDGVHLDYIRLSNGTAWCYCDEHKRKFQAQYGRPPAAGDPDWMAFRFETISRLVGNIHDAIVQVRPRVRLSAAVTRFFSFQDPRTWFRRGKLDILFPMLYAVDLATFEQRSRDYNMGSNGRHVMPGIGATNGKIADEIDIARRLGCEGQAIFAASQLDATHAPIFAAKYPAPAPPPPCPWKDGLPDETPPEVGEVRAAAGIDEAIFEWATDEETVGRVEIRLSGEPPDRAAIVQGSGAGWDHRMVVRGLAPQTAYEAHVVAVDRAGNWRASADVAFTTLANGPIDIVVDDGDSGYVEVGSWSDGSAQGGNAGDYRYAGRAAAESASATWTPPLPRSGRYRVSTWYVAGTNRSADAAFEIGHAGGARQVVRVNQQTAGRQWVPLGEFPFDAGTSGSVRLSNAAATGSVVIADAVRFEYVGP